MIPRLREHMIQLGCALAVCTVVFGVVTVTSRPFDVVGFVPLALFVAACIVGGAVRSTPDGRLPVAAARFVTAACVVMPVLAALPLDPARDTFSSGGWYVAGIALLIAMLMMRSHRGLAWVALVPLVVHTLVWAGPFGLVTFAVIGMVLIIGAAEVGTRAVLKTAADVASFSSAERAALEWQAAQEAHHFQREVRLAEISRVAADMLHHIIDSRGRLDTAARAECRVLEQTIRDEVRGRRLLNAALREQIIAHRRNGAVVQVNDDGGIDDIDPELIDPMLTRIALALDGLQSDRIIIRTAPADSPKALSVVAFSADPIAAALGLDDGDDKVDLWLEFDRPVALV